MTLNGQSAEVAVKLAAGLVALLIVAVTAIVITGKVIPEIFTAAITLLAGFLVGTRVVTPEVAREVQKSENVKYGRRADDMRADPEEGGSNG